MIRIEKPSLQSLLIEMCFGDQPISTGTAFVCESKKGPVLVTNWHNVTGRNIQTKSLLSRTGAIPDNIRISHNRAGKCGEWLIKTEPLFNNGGVRWVEHPTLGDRADLVALPLSDLQDVELYPYDILGGTDIAISPAEPISVIGFPFGLPAGGSLAIWATGFVASEPQIDLYNLPLFLIDCRTRPGQSGSAVISYRGGGAVPMEGGGTAVFGSPVTKFRGISKFRGIYSGRINDQSDLGMVWKASAVDQLVASI